MIYQSRYHLSIVEEQNYYSAVLRHFGSKSEYTFEWDKNSKDNEFPTLKKTKREFEKFFKKEFFGCHKRQFFGCDFYVHSFDTNTSTRIENFYPTTGSYLIIKPLEWHEFINNWMEFSSSEEISSSEEEELSRLWREKFPSFDLYRFYSYYPIEAFGERLASYLD